MMKSTASGGMAGKVRGKAPEDASAGGGGVGGVNSGRGPVAPTESAGVSSSAALSSAKPMRILIADDNVDAAEALSELLVLVGHSTRVAHDGAAAVRVAREFRPDLALIDIGMPVMDGLEVARQLRQCPDTAGALLIALTGWGGENDHERSMAAGFNHHCTKPIQFKTLCMLLADLR